MYKNDNRCLFRLADQNNNVHFNDHLIAQYNYLKTAQKNSTSFVEIVSFCVKQIPGMQVLHTQNPSLLFFSSKIENSERSLNKIHFCFSFQLKHFTTETNYII